MGKQNLSFAGASTNENMRTSLSLNFTDTSWDASAVLKIFLEEKHMHSQTDHARAPCTSERLLVSALTSAVRVRGRIRSTFDSFQLRRLFKTIIKATIDASIYILSTTTFYDCTRRSLLVKTTADRKQY